MVREVKPLADPCKYSGGKVDLTPRRTTDEPPMTVGFVEMVASEVLPTEIVTVAPPVRVSSAESAG